MDKLVLAHMKEQSRLSLGSYNRPRMAKELKGGGVDVGHRRVGRLMRESRIVFEEARELEPQEPKAIVLGKSKATHERKRTFDLIY